QDSDGFWLHPHTDLGVKRFTMLIYLSDGADQADLGTDIYADDRSWAKRTAFVDNSALVFVPSDNTWHGLEPRKIAGVRKSVIMNYVTRGWRERGQLAYPETPVRI
ncbi:MAG TPA: 2OG-Fe(II) oxygenase, partial [Caulobacteraceae bacterium]